MGAGESYEQNLWRSTFELQSRNSRLGLIRLTDKQTQDSYICRKLSVLDRRQIDEIDRLVDIKLSIQSPYLVKLQKATSHANHQSCSYGKNYYLLFKQPYQTLKQETLSRKFKNSIYSQTELQMMLQVGIKALFFLKNINHAHENISSSAFFINENRSMILGDPFMFSRENQPAKVRNGFVYPSPQLIKYQNHEIEDYNKHLSDLFTFGLVLLQVFYMINMDCVYEKYFERVNHQVIHQKLSAINSFELRKKLFILVDPQPRNRELIFKHYIKSIPAKDIFDKLQKEKFKKTIDRYNLATSQVTEWKNDIAGVENRLLSSQAEGKKTFSVSTNQNPPNVHQDKMTNNQIQYQPQSQLRPLSLRPVQIAQKRSYEVPKQIDNNYYQHGGNIRSSQPTQQNHPHVQSNYLPQNNQYQISQPPVFHKTSQPYYHQTSYGSYGNLPFQSQMNNFGNINSVQGIDKNYQSNYVPSQSIGNYSQPLVSQTYSKQQQTQYFLPKYSPNTSMYSNLSTYSPYQYKQLQSTPLIAPKINDLSTNQLNSNFNSFPYYHTNFLQSQLPLSQTNIGIQIQAKTPENKVSPNSNSQSPNQSLKQSSKDDNHQLEINTSKVQQNHESVNTSITQKQTQTAHEITTNNLLNISQNTYTSSTPAKQKIKHTDYNKYRHLSTINERSEMADSFISELYENKSQILIQQDNSLNAEKSRDYHSQRENIHNSFIEQIKVWSISYPSGTKYMGEVKNDKRNGLGTFFYIDGSKYHGHWLDNKMNGFGTLYYPNGKIAYQGEWKTDNFHGKGKVFNDQIEHFTENYYYQNCSDIDNYWLEYDGELMEDKKHGKGTLKLANGEYFEAQFKNDQLNGLCKFYSRDNKIIEGLWENSKLLKAISERAKE